MIDTTNMGIMANFIQVAPIAQSNQALNKNNSENDSSLFEEVKNIDNDFSSYELDLSSLTQESKLAEAIESSITELNGEMPSQEEFQSMLASFGYEAPTNTNENRNSSESEYETAVKESAFNTNENETNTFEESNNNENTTATTNTSNTSSTSNIDSNQNALANLSMLMNALKSGKEDSNSSLNKNDTKNFDGLLKTINNQNNNGQINTYLQNQNTSSLFTYA